MIGAGHLHDDHLYECYFAECAGDPLDPRAAEHLADCPTCGARFAEIAGAMNDMRDVAEEESDELFTVERLRHQREHILHRLESLNRSARVIFFPGQGARSMNRGTTRIAPRWLAAAAAAGLFIGVAVGGRFSTPRNLPPMHVASAPNRIAPQPASRVSAPEPTPAAELVDDDEFLVQLEFALERPHTRALQPFDALTPPALEAGFRPR